MNVALVSGTVFVRAKGQKRFHRLLGIESIPTGSTVDTRRGRVALTAAVDTKGKVQTLTSSPAGSGCASGAGATPSPT